MNEKASEKQRKVIGFGNGIGNGIGPKNTLSLWTRENLREYPGLVNLMGRPSDSDKVFLWREVKTNQPING